MEAVFWLVIGALAFYVLSCPDRRNSTKKWVKDICSKEKNED